MLRWREGGWEVQDLGSHNGTYVDGRVLSSGQRVDLVEGARLGFGRADEYTLIDAGPPVPHAINLDGSGRTSVAEEGLLALPTSDAPALTVLHSDQRWWIERGEALREIEDGEIVEVGAERWKLYLPEILPSTRDWEEAAPTLATLTLRFSLRDNGRSIALCAVRGERVIDLKARAHHGPLLALARARLRDQAARGKADGWVAQADLIALLGCDAGRLNVDIHRLRHQLAKAGIADAAHIIERRRKNHALRIYPMRIEIITVDAPTSEPTDTGSLP